MGDDYWNSSSVTKKVSQQGIFDGDEGNTIDRFKTRSDPMIEHILDSSRTTTGAVSTRFRPTPANNPPPPKPTPTPTPTPTPITTARPAAVNNLPKAAMPTSQVLRTFDQPSGSARYGRTPAPATSNDSHSNAQWLPTAEEYPDQNTKDRSTQYDREMELLCKKLLENTATRKTDYVKLDDIRDFDKKASLLRVAVSFNTPSVIVPVIIFLENTLSRPLVYELIKQHPSAINSYINMAKLSLESDYHIAMLKQFGKNEDVAMIRLRQVSQTNDINTKIAILDQAATELGSHPWWHLQIAEQRLLLLKQRESPNLQTNRTVLETYKTVYKDDFLRQKQNKNTSRVEIDRSKDYESTFHMSPEIIMCGKLSVIMQCGLRQHFDDFVHQAIHQSIFGKKYIIAPEYLADMVYNWVIYSGDGEQKASEKTERFLTMIADPIKRIYFAEKFQNFDVAMATIVNDLRDRFQLENLRRRMPQNHPSFNRATALLENTKWRN